MTAGDQTTYPRGAFAHFSAALSEFRTPSGAKRGFTDLVRGRVSGLPSAAHSKQQKVPVPNLDQAIAVTATQPASGPSTETLVLLIGRHGSDVMEIPNVGLNCAGAPATAQLSLLESLAGQVGQHIE